MHAQRNFGMGAREVEQHGRQIKVAQACRQPDANVSPDGPVQAVDGGLHRAHFVKQADAMLVEQLPGLGQLDMPGGPPEELRAQIQFKPLQTMRHV
ncbi:hypothetical protein D3C71_1833870 [compost metagenome]